VVDVLNVDRAVEEDIRGGKNRSTLGVGRVHSWRVGDLRNAFDVGKQDDPHGRTVSNRCR
jgi:hypothetical protein